MKNIKGRMHRELKAISISPKWRTPPLVFQQPANLERKQIKNLGPRMSETSLDEDEDKFKSSAASKEESHEIITAHDYKEIGSPTKPEAVTGLKKHEEVLLEYEEKCPPAGKECVVLYSTSLRGIRKTFEDCNAICFLLGSFKVVYSERDVSTHLEYREELWGVLGGRVVPPRLFIRGRYIGGADKVIGLHEKGMLQMLLHGIPLSPTTCPCRGCAGMGFLLCCSCSGSRKIMEDGLTWIRCQDCNENGLIKCSACS